MIRESVNQSVRSDLLPGGVSRREPDTPSTKSGRCVGPQSMAPGSGALSSEGIECRHLEGLRSRKTPGDSQVKFLSSLFDIFTLKPSISSVLGVDRKFQAPPISSRREARERPDHHGPAGPRGPAHRDPGGRGQRRRVNRSTDDTGVAERSGGSTHGRSGRRIDPRSVAPCSANPTRRRLHHAGRLRRRRGHRNTRPTRGAPFRRTA